MQLELQLAQLMSKEQSEDPAENEHLLEQIRALKREIDDIEKVRREVNHIHLLIFRVMRVS
ncbi:hypothetical protein [Scopulibacillus darangshiensis]|uniref:hypothetical protein n=1 Tax=Scopulibacillus darangshiensis TaxID=442528 RepID=UPI00104B7A24|nr:hypothetical protein [Scopulibacillus darangshiensis]